MYLTGKAEKHATINRDYRKLYSFLALNKDKGTLSLLFLLRTLQFNSNATQSLWRILYILG